MRFRIIGQGRAGGAFGKALTSVGWEMDATYGRSDDVSAAAAGVPVLLLCVPDRAIKTVAAAVEAADAVVVHVAGSQTLGVLHGHDRVGSVHPLMTMPDATRGARALLDDCRFAVAGDPITTTIVEALGGRAFPVTDDQRMRYHAGAVVASNHLVALTAHVQRLAALAGVPTDAYWQLMSVSLTNVIQSDPATALTGPAARADWATIAGHLDALPAAPDTDRTLYLALAAEAARLAGNELPGDLS